MPKFAPIRGLIAAPHTPFTPDGDVDFERIPDQIRILSKQGLAGVFVNGTTGEGLSLTSAERQSILELWTGLAPARLKVIVHVGHHSQREAAALAEHAAAHGAYGISAMGPSFLKPPGAYELAEFCHAIAAAAPQLAFYYYHIPSLSGVNLPMVDFLSAAKDRIPNLAGIKFTHGDLFEYQRCRAADDGSFDILWGLDEALLGALAVGASGAVGSTYNYAAPTYLRMIEAFNRGDHETARRCSLDAVRLVEVLIKFGVLASGKAIMSMHGVDCGPPRSPLAPLTADERAQLLREIVALEIISTD